MFRLYARGHARRRQGLCGLFCGCLIGITRIAELPGILGERRRPAKQRVQAAIDLATRFSQFDQVVRFAERNAMPRQERFQRFLRSLLSVKDNVIGERRVCLQFILGGRQILAPLRKPGAHLGDEGGIMPHGGVFPRE
jgi:hypothetical protein